MILPGQHESQTEEEEYDDDDDEYTSSSGVQSSRDNPSPHPLPSKSSPHHASPKRPMAFITRQVPRPNAGILDVSPVFRPADIPRQESHATNGLRQQDLEMEERALTHHNYLNSNQSAQSHVPMTIITATTTTGTSTVSPGVRAVSTSPPISLTRTKSLNNITVNSINNNNKNNGISSNDTHLNSISNPKQGQRTSGTEKSNSSIPATNTSELINDHQFGHDHGVTTASTIAPATLAAGTLNNAHGTRDVQDNTNTAANQHHPTPAQGRTGHGGNNTRSRGISKNSANHDNIGNSTRSSQYNPHGSLISQRNLPPSTTIKPFAFFGRFSKENKSRKKRDSLQLLHQNQPRLLSQLGSTTPPEMNSATGSKNDLILDRRHLKNERVPEKVTSQYQHRRGSRKRGVPGKDGEEPETDMFKFVDIMLDMPDEPTWRLVIIKLLKVLTVMTISYFALMALYFAAEVNK